MPMVQILKDLVAWEALAKCVDRYTILHLCVGALVEAFLKRQYFIEDHILQRVQPIVPGAQFNKRFVRGHSMNAALSGNRWSR